MELIRSTSAMQAWALGARRHGKSLALVPTMGYLHEGHLSLVAKARQHADLVVVSIFVNPIQFGPTEDLDRYPRDEAGDLSKLATAGVDVVFLPLASDMYPVGFQTHVDVERLPMHLCGLRRHGHFRGVSTVVAKFFLICQPDVAVFGSKDYQQLKVIEQMVRDLAFPVKIVAGETVREPDGLAMSSRNAYLTPQQRTEALCLSQALHLARDMVVSGETNCAVIKTQMQDMISRTQGKIDYISIMDPDSLDEISIIDSSAHAALAVYFGSTRLIDNLRLKG